MEIFLIGLICTAVFGVILSIAAFIRQLMLSRDKQLNDLALNKAFDLAAEKLGEMRQQRENFNTKFPLDFCVKQIEDISTDIKYYIAVKEALVSKFKDCNKNNNSGQLNVNALTLSDQDAALEKVETIILELIKSKHKWGEAYYEMQKEKTTNDRETNALFSQHTIILEKTISNNNENSEKITKELIDAGKESFQNYITLPFQAFINYFRLTKDSSPEQFEKEKTSRQKVVTTEKELPASPNSHSGGLFETKPQTKPSRPPMVKPREEKSDDFEQFSKLKRRRSTEL